MKGVAVKSALRWSLVVLGWLLLAPVLAAFIWTLMETLAPLPQDTSTSSRTSGPEVLWITNLDDYWQPAQEQQPLEEVQPVERSRLRVDVQGVLFSSRPERSLVLLKYRNQDRTLSIGDQLEEGVTLAEIHQDALIFNRNGRLERVDWQLAQEDRQSRRSSLLDQGEATTSSRRSPEGRSQANQRAATGNSEASDAAVESQQISRQETVGIRPLEETFGPDFRESLVRDPLQLMRHITVSPHNEGGQLQGFRIRPGSDPALFESLGLEAGDLVVSVDGVPVSDTAAMMNLHGQLATARSLDVEILRDGERLLFSLEME
ncbi:type II secretion system protein C [Marinospirillum celere]|uniref:Type II secretion system protein C n=1 Tax=Marinospirillum celere TaxID=1122252 RepID=A0A1I1G1X9_9GAMM|nr:type II secretion system protein GspC [Marinospirillum celere]SFC05839.1 type II secretion system protein C [Marinospirillum celere]